MAKKHPDITMINLDKRLAVDKDGKSYPVTNMFDGDGEEVDEDDGQVKAIVVKVDDKNWLTIDMSHFDPLKAN